MTTERSLWISEDPASQKLFELAQRVAPVGNPILITGESGTGKKYLSRLIHELGPRRGLPLLAVDCGNLPPELYEADLFGGEQADGDDSAEQHLGAFELAGRGTVVLDEVGNLSTRAQALLLKILQDHAYERASGKASLRADARVTALSTADIGKAVKEGRLREELFFRLDITKIWMPPLRERAADILPLAIHFLGIASKRYGKAATHFGENAEKALKTSRWPGNVQELRNCVERAVLASQRDTVTLEDFPAEMRSNAHNGNSGPVRPLEDVERETIVATLEATRYQIGRSAQMLGISRKTLLEKRKKFGLK